MSLLVATILAAGGWLVGRWIAKAALPKPGEEPPEDDKGTTEGAARAALPEPLPDLGEFPCRLGDVVTRSSGGEAWLAGALIFSEERPVAALFFAPEAGGDRAIFARPRPAASLAWLEPLPDGAIAMGEEPPAALEHSGRQLQRTRRLPVRVTRAGTGAPDVGDQVIVAEYSSMAGDRLLAVLGPHGVRAYFGTVLEEGAYDVLPGS